MDGAVFGSTLEHYCIKSLRWNQMIWGKLHKVGNGVTEQNKAYKVVLADFRFLTDPLFGQ